MVSPSFILCFLFAKSCTDRVLFLSFLQIIYTAEFGGTGILTLAIAHSAFLDLTF
jgi:hypothetical protein